MTRLRTLGELALEGSDFRGPKPLALLAFLTLEGPQDRRYLAELFWPHARDRPKSLTVALAQLRRGAPGAVAADRRRAWSRVDLDVHDLLAELEARRRATAVEAYRGPFLHGVHLHDLGGELEEWLYRTREFVADHVADARLTLAEREAAQGRPDAALAHAEAAYAVPGAPPLAPENLARLVPLLAAGRSPLLRAVRDEVAEAGIDLEDAPPAPAPLPWPRAVTGFVGRRAELREAADRLADPDGRLLTIVGPPGVGKTRLAHELGREAVAAGAWDGVHWVALETVDDPRRLAGAVAGALGLTPGGDDAWRTVVAALGTGRHLLLLDNVEGLAEGAAQLDRVLTACPNVALVVTSRVRLGLAGERLLRLEGLAYPAPGDAAVAGAREADAVALFVRRARRVRPDFAADEATLPDVLAICRRTGGLPLALELAASWTRLMSCADIAAELQHGLELLSGSERDVPERHRSVRAALGGAWRMLPARDREAAVRLAAFHGGFGRAAAREVAGAGLPRLASLLDASLLSWDGGDRYALHPLVRAFVRDRAAASPGAWDEARDRHAVLVLRWLGERADAFRHGTAAIPFDVEDAVAAWRWAAAHGRRDLLGPALDALGWWLFMRGRYALGSRLFDEADADAIPPLRRARFRAMFLVALDRPGEAAAAVEAALAAEAVPAPATPPGAGAGDAALLDRAHALRVLGVARSAADPPDPARAAADFRAARTIYERLDDAEGTAMMLNNLAHTAADADEALALVTRAVALARAAGRTHALAMALGTRAELLFHRKGDAAAAAGAARESVELHDASAFTAQVADALILHGEILLAAGDAAGAAAEAERLLDLCPGFDAGPAAARRAAGLDLRARAAARRAVGDGAVGGGTLGDAAGGDGARRDAGG